MHHNYFLNTQSQHHPSQTDLERITLYPLGTIIANVWQTCQPGAPHGSHPFSSWTSVWYFSGLTVCPAVLGHWKTPCLQCLQLQSHTQMAWWSDNHTEKQQSEPGCGLTQWVWDHSVNKHTSSVCICSTFKFRSFYRLESSLSCTQMHSFTYIHFINKAYLLAYKNMNSSNANVTWPSCRI